MQGNPNDNDNTSSTALAWQTVEADLSRAATEVTESFADLGFKVSTKDRLSGGHPLSVWEAVVVEVSLTTALKILDRLQAAEGGDAA